MLVISTLTKYSARYAAALAVSPHVVVRLIGVSTAFSKIFPVSSFCGVGNAAVERTTLTIPDDNGELAEREVIWRQSPKVLGTGHHSHRVREPDGAIYVLEDGG